MKCPRSPLIAFCFSKLGRHSCSINKQTSQTIEQLPTMSKERERDLQERCLWPSGFAKSIAAMSNRPATWSLPLSQPLNEWSNRSPACCRKSPKCFFPMQTTFTAALNLHKLSHCSVQQQCNASQCNNSSVAGKGIWVTGFLWLAQFATKLSLIGSSPLLSRIKTRIDKGKDKEKYQYKDKDKDKDKMRNQDRDARQRHENMLIVQLKLYEGKRYILMCVLLPFCRYFIFAQLKN